MTAYRPWQKSGQQLQFQVRWRPCAFRRLMQLFAGRQVMTTAVCLYITNTALQQEQRTCKVSQKQIQLEDGTP
jgi:hypothetical protein